MTGLSVGSKGNFDYATVAYDASTGTKLWVARYNGPANSTDVPTALGVGPGGAEVFVAGQSIGSTSNYDYATAAYDAATGAELWSKRYNGPGNDFDSAHALGVSPDGSEVFVTGASTGASGSYFVDYMTVAYDAFTGTKVWAKRYNGTANRYDTAFALGVDPGGNEVFVTGRSRGSASGDDYATVAYGASTGVELWRTSYDGTGNRADVPTALEVGPDGSEVYVTGHSKGSTSYDDYATVAYDASTGAQLWVARYNGRRNFYDYAHSLGVSPDGSELFVTGESLSTSYVDYATVAYDVA